MRTQVNRRSFMRASGTALAAACALPHVSPARAGQFTGRIRKGVKYHMIGEGDTPEAKFRLVKELGFAGLEVHRRELKNTEREAFREASQASGLLIHGVLNSSDVDLQFSIDAAEYFGASSVLVVAGRVNAENSYDANYKFTVGWLREAAGYAEQKNIRLLVENVWNDFLLSPLEMARFLDEIDSPAVGAYFDVGNVVRLGYPEQWVRILGERIGKLDIKDYSRDLAATKGPRAGFSAELGEGSVDWKRVRHALAETSYEGWATAEVKGGDRQRLAEIAARMDNVLDL